MAQQTGEKREEMGVDLHLQGGREREGEREGARLLLFLRPRQIDRLQLASGLISAVYVTLAESACLPAWLHVTSRLFTPHCTAPARTARPLIGVN